MGSIEKDLASPFHALVLTGLSRELSKAGYALSILPVDDRSPATLQREVGRTIRGGHADAYFIPFGFLCREIIEEIQARRVAAVTLLNNSASVSAPGVGAVTLDEEPGARELARELARCGHRRVAYFRPKISPEPRFRAFRVAAADVDIEIADADCIEYETTESSSPLLDRQHGRIAAARHFDRLISHSAIVCSSDLGALGLVDVLREHGLVIGRDISVAGCDNLEDNPNFPVREPFLSSVDRSNRALGAALGGLVLERLQDPEAPLRVLTVPTRFIRRSSLGAATKTNGRVGQPAVSDQRT
jgi:LacI family transcriptional regulator